MNEDLQKQFVSWLADKLQAKDESDLKAKMQQMGSQGIKQAYQAFMQEQQSGAQGGGVPSQALGGKLDYLRCLQAFKKGGKMEMDKCGCGGKMEKGGEMPQPAKKNYLSKHQAGGFIPANQPNLMQVQKDNGSIGSWGNQIQGQSKNYALHPSTVGPQQISEQQLIHLRNSVPQFDAKIGKPVAARPGEVERYGPEQSDLIRKLVVAYPMNAMPMGQQLAAHAKGGVVSDHSMGSRKDFNKMGHKKDSMTDTKLQEHSQGSRGSEGHKEHSMGSRTNGPSKMQHKKDSRKDAEKMSWQQSSRKEDNRKRKDYVGFAKSGAKMKPEMCQDGGDMEAQSQKKGGKVSAADKKVIQLKKMDAAKHQMGGSMSAQPAPVPANASGRMAGKGKKKSMQPASMNRLGGLLGK